VGKNLHGRSKEHFSSVFPSPKDAKRMIGGTFVGAGLCVTNISVLYFPEISPKYFFISLQIPTFASRL
jgi:hypothetical protein